MSNHVLESQRHKKRVKSTRTFHNFYQGALEEHAEPLVVRRREEAIANADFGKTIVLEPTMVDLCEHFLLKIETTATGGGTTSPLFGLNVIKSIQVRSGGNQLIDYPFYDTFLKWSLSNCNRETRENIEEIYFGDATANAQTVYIPLPYMGSPIYTKNWAGGVPLPLGALNSKRPISFHIEFETKANLVNGDVSTLAMTATLEYDEIVVKRPELYRKGWSVAHVDIQQLASQEALVANTEKEVQGLESMQGAWDFVLIETTPTANDVAGGNKMVQSRLKEMELIVDGQSFHKVKDEKRNRIDSFQRKKQENKAADESGSNYIFFGRTGKNEAVLHTDGAKRISLKVKSKVNVNATVCVGRLRCWFSAGNSIKVKES